PYPGSRLFDECKANNELLTEDWDDYDMKTAVMKTPCGKDKIMKLVQGIYGVALNPEFIIRRLISIRDIYDVKYFFRGFRKVFGHIFDFKKQ
ncbi:MAG: B12-binding domain-containing radical SAM protein, partial [Candidatus Omnitrophica bacterium]|nr:B12-binding domain-containing radical SAM protein [Candidatus Omnitrophota bacterium]